MDELERRIFEDVKSELVMCKHEKKRLSEKLDCLIILLRRAWQGDDGCIVKLSEIVGIRAPKIIPCKEDLNSNQEVGRESLQVTSSMLDEQLQEDLMRRKTTKTLRPSSAKYLRPATERTRPASQRPKSSKFLRQKKPPIPTGDCDLMVTAKQKNLRSQSATSLSNTRQRGTVDNFAMGELANFLPNFSGATFKGKAPKKKSPTEDEKNACRESRMLIDRKIPLDLFDPEPIVGPNKNRPLRAATQQRQDYLRSQNKKRKPRPQTAAPAFNRTEIVSESPRFCLTHQSSTSSADMDDDYLFCTRSVDHEPREYPISVDISKKWASQRQGSSPNRNVLPDEQENRFGDVSHALQSVQVSQRAFKVNARKLQERIGVTEAGYV